VSGSCIVGSEFVVALFGAQQLEFLERLLFVRCKMAKMALQARLSFGGFSGRRPMLFWGRSITVHFDGIITVTLGTYLMHSKVLRRGLQVQRDTKAYPMLTRRDNAKRYIMAGMGINKPNES